MADYFEEEMVVLSQVHVFCDLEVRAAWADWQQQMHVAVGLPAPTY